VILAAAFMLLAVGACTVRADTIKLGVSSALSGDAATYGLDIKDALLFANQKYGDGRYEFVFEDDRCSGRDAVSVAHKLIDIDKVDAVLGFACSGAALAALPIYEKAHIPVMVTTASSPKIRDAGS